MKALVYHGPGRKAWEQVPDPTVLQATDAVVQIDTTTICGTDLHILRGDVPAVTEGRVLGHEGVGTVVAVGPAVRNHRVGDRVIIACISACGVCTYCRSGNASHCLADEGAVGTGWILGHLIDGTQAEYVRTPFADTSLHALPDGVPDDAAILLSDVLPSGFEMGVQCGQVKPGDTVAVIGAGPIGLAVVATAGLQGAARIVAVDLDDRRLAKALAVGATHAVNAAAPDWRDQVVALTDGYGVDVAVEAVGMPGTFTMCLDIVRPGGHVANLGVHGQPVELRLDQLWRANLGITLGQVNADSLGMLLKLVAQDRLAIAEFVTHRFSLSHILDAYGVFTDAARTGALKLAIAR
jgi:alcohol dehydrogenase